MIVKDTNHFWWCRDMTPNLCYGSSYCGNVLGRRLTDLLIAYNGGREFGLDVRRQFKDDDIAAHNEYQKQVSYFHDRYQNNIF